jgi:hypothetical protein
MTIPVLFEKPIIVWLGIVLVLLLYLQLVTGIMRSRGRYNFLPHHKFNALLIVIVVGVHAFYGIGLWFFDFRIDY